MTHVSWVRYKNGLRGRVRVRRIVRKTGDMKGNGGRKKINVAPEPVCRKFHQVKSRTSKCEAPIPNGTVACLRRHRDTRTRTNRTTANVYPAASCLILKVCPPFVWFSAVSLCCGAARSNYARVFWDSVGVFAAFCGLPKLKRAAIGFALAALVSVSKHSGRLLEIQLGKLLAPALTQRKMTDKISREHTRHFSTMQLQP